MLLFRRFCSLAFLFFFSNFYHPSGDALASRYLGTSPLDQNQGPSTPIMTSGTHSKLSPKLTASPASCRSDSRSDNDSDSHEDANMRHATLIAPMSNGSAFHILSAGINRTYPNNNNDSNKVQPNMLNHDNLPHGSVGVDVGGGILRMGYGISRAGKLTRPVC